MPKRINLTPAPDDPDNERILLLLGLLSVQNRHGYELHEMIDRQLQHIIQLKKTTAYQLLGRLEAHGLIRSYPEAHPQRPKRKVYALTESGTALFHAMLSRHMEEQARLLLPSNVPILFAEQMKHADLLLALRRRLATVEAHLAFYDSFTFPFPFGVGLAIGRIRALTAADRDWLQQTIEKIERQDTPLPPRANMGAS